MKHIFRSLRTKMIDFACKKLDIEDIIRCSFALSKSEYQVLIFLIKQNQPLTPKKIKNKLKIDLTTVQRSVKKLHEKDLLIRSQRNLSPGGYVFCYKMKSKTIVKEKMKEILNIWNDNVIKSIEKW